MLNSAAIIYFIVHSSQMLKETLDTGYKGRVEEST